MAPTLETVQSQTEDWLDLERAAVVEVTSEEKDFPVEAALVFGEKRGWRATDYHFTSPIDNALDRMTYLERCWPNSKMMEAFDYIYGAEFGDHALIVYEARTNSGKRFRNSEVHTVRDGKLVATEVYFGWDLPHRAPAGSFIENDGAGHA